MDYSPLFISLKTSVLATIITFALGILAANKVRNINRFRGLIDGIFTLPLVLPPTVLGFFLLILFGRNSLIGTLLAKVDVNIIFSWEATVITAVVAAFPLMYRTTLGSFDDIDENLIFAAQTLGMSNLQIFWKIILPNSISGIMGGTILAFARTLGEFGATMMLAGNIKGQTRTIAIAVYTAVQGGDRRTAYMWTMVIMVISFTMIIGMNYFNNRQKVRKMR